MAERTTEATNTLEQFRVNFNNLVTDIGDVYVGTNKQLNTSANDVVGAINEIFAGMQLSAQINTHGQQSFLQSSNAETLTLQGGTVFILVAQQPTLLQTLQQTIQCHSY